MAKFVDIIRELNNKIVHTINTIGNKQINSFERNSINISNVLDFIGEQFEAYGNKYSYLVTFNFVINDIYVGADEHGLISYNDRCSIEWVVDANLWDSFTVLGNTIVTINQSQHYAGEYNSLPLYIDKIIYFNYIPGSSVLKVLDNTTKSEKSIQGNSVNITIHRTKYKPW